MIFTTAAIALVALSGVSAQSSQSAPNSKEMSQAASKLSYPPSRGSNPLVSRIGPCQAYERGGRIEYPLSGGRVSWNNIRDISNVQIAYSTEADPTSQDQFTPVGTNLTTSWVGSQCIQGPDFAGLGLAEGQQVTLQLSYQTGPGLWPMYECADLTLLSPSSFSALNMTVPCENNVLTTQTRSRANPTLTQLQADAAAEEAAAAQASISAHAASYGYTQGGSSSGSGSKLSATEAGVVGAMTTLGVAIIALLSARLFGVVAFGKKAVKERQEQVPRLCEQADEQLEKSASYGSSAA